MVRDGKGARVSRPAQPRIRKQVDIERALSESEGIMKLWRIQKSQPTAPLFSGGLWDSWPAYVVDALVVCEQEFSVINAHTSNERLLGR